MGKLTRKVEENKEEEEQRQIEEIEKTLVEKVIEIDKGDRTSKSTKEQDTIINQLVAKKGS